MYIRETAWRLTMITGYPNAARAAALCLRRLAPGNKIVRRLPEALDSTPAGES